jgi:hypothetical protein
MGCLILPLPYPFVTFAILNYHLDISLCWKKLENNNTFITFHGTFHYWLHGLILIKRFTRLTVLLKRKLEIQISGYRMHACSNDLCNIMRVFHVSHLTICKSICFIKYKVLFCLIVFVFIKQIVSYKLFLQLFLVVDVVVILIGSHKLCKHTLLLLLFCKTSR